VQQAYNATEPGGWAEFQDFDIAYYEDGSLREDQSISRWIGSKLEVWMEDAGFEGVQHRKFKLLIGPWAWDKDLVRSD